MTRSNRNMYQTIVTGEPFLSRCKLYHDSYNRCTEAYSAFALKYSAKRYCAFFLRHVGLTALEFSDKAAVPSDWKRPDRHNRSFPKKTSPAFKEMKELPTMSFIGYDVYGEEIPASIEYTFGTEDKYGGSTLTCPRSFDAQVTWCTVDGQRIFFLGVPDIPAICQRLIDENKEYSDKEIIIADKLLNWTLPNGLERISDARYDLYFAQSRVEDEEREDAEAA